MQPRWLRGVLCDTVLVRVCVWSAMFLSHWHVRRVWPLALSLSGLLMGDVNRQSCENSIMLVFRRKFGGGGSSNKGSLSSFSYVWETFHFLRRRGCSNPLDAFLLHWRGSMPPHRFGCSVDGPWASLSLMRPCISFSSSVMRSRLDASIGLLFYSEEEWCRQLCSGRRLHLSTGN